MNELPLFDGVPNSRGVSDLPLTGGGSIREGVLYRSSALDSITATGLDQLRTSPIGIVADLRSTMERQMGEDVLPSLRHIEAVDANIEVGNMMPHSGAATTKGLSGSHWKTHLESALVGEAESFLPSLGHMYEMMLREAAKQFALVASLVAQVQPGANNAVLVHCTAGKDRTGLSTALILDAVGVQREAIIENYAKSQEYLAQGWSEGMLNRIEQAGIPLKPKLVTLVTSTPPHAMEQALNWVDKHHGSSADYLKSGGLSTQQVDRLHSALI